MLDAELNTLPAMHQMKGALRTSAPHSSALLTTRLGAELLDDALSFISFWAQHYVVDMTR